MLGFNRRLDRIQGRRTVFVVGNPIIKTLCATVGFSDVTSANIVGYSNKDLRGNGQLASAVFENVGVAKTIKVSELKITGYEEAYAGSGFDCMLTFTRMDEFGRTMEDPELHGADACMFYFSATWDGENNKWNDPVWYDLDGNEVNAENDFTFDFGEGFWLNAPESIDGEVLKLVSSGQVVAEDYSYPLRGNGNVVANPAPIDVAVFDMGVSGYEEAYAGSGFDCMLTFTRMDEFGRTMEDPELHGADACMFYFSATWDGENGKWNDPVWYDLDGNEVTDRTAKLLSGEGVWCNAPESIAGETLTLDFPSPLNTKVVDED